MSLILRSFPDFDIVEETNKGRDVFRVVERSTRQTIFLGTSYETALRLTLMRQEAIIRVSKPQSFENVRLYKVGNYAVNRTTARTKFGLIWIYELRDTRDGSLIESSKSYVRLCQRAFRANGGMPA